MKVIFLQLSLTKPAPAASRSKVVRNCDMVKGEVFNYQPSLLRVNTCIITPPMKFLLPPFHYVRERNSELILKRPEYLAPPEQKRYFFFSSLSEHALLILFTSRQLTDPDPSIPVPASVRCSIQHRSRLLSPL